MREPNLTVKIELPPKIVEAFVNHFSPVDAKVPGLASRLMDYLLEGRGIAVLDELRQIHDAAEVMELSLHSRAKANPLREAGFYSERFEPLELYLRLSHIWENATVMLARNPVLAGLPDEGRWLETFLWEFQGRRHDTWSSVPATAITVDDIEQLLIWRGQPPEWLVRSGLYILEGHRQHRFIRGTKGYFTSIPNMGAAYVRHKATVAESFQQKDHIAREETLDILAVFDETLEPFADIWAECAVNSAKGIRERALQLITRAPAPSLPHLQKWAREGSSAQRGYAINALASVYKNEARDFLEARLSDEKAAKIIETIKDALTALQAIESQVEKSVQPDMSIEKEAPLSPIVPLDESAKEVLRKYAVSYKELAVPLAYPKYRLSFTEDEVAEMIRFMESFTFDQVEAMKGRNTRIIKNDREGKMRKLTTRVASHPTFQFIHVLRWQIFLEDYWETKTREFSLSYLSDEYLNAYVARGGVIPDLETQSRIVDSMGFDGKRYAAGYLYKYGPPYRPLAYQIPLEQTLSFFSQHLEIIGDILRNDVVVHRRVENCREISFAVLQALPRIPASLVTILWDIALTGKKKERPLSQAVLNRYTDKNEKILKALANSKGELRSNAVEWIADLKDPTFLPPLKQALAIEKQEALRLAIQMAIEQIGGSAKDLGLKGAIDVKALESEMATLVKKGRPKQLGWVDPKTFPKVLWSKSGKPVSPTILEGLIIQAYRLKNPEPGPELRRICAATREGDREKLSAVLLKAWITNDERERYTETQARYEARNISKNWHGPAFDEAYGALKEKIDDSSSASKGVFAFIGACSTGSIAAAVFRYIKNCSLDKSR